MTHVRAFVCAIVLAMAGAAGAGEPGRFSGNLPEELRFSDGAGGSSHEADGLAGQLANGDPADRLLAAQELWTGHSRPNAADVLKYLAGPPPGGEDFRTFQREVEDSLRPDAILKELKEGDFAWGAWLAFLRPHKDLVPPLLAALKDRKDDELAAVMLALGNAGDPRALDPLVALAKSKEYRTAGDAAFALGYLGDPKAEPTLIELVTAGRNWAQLRACEALAITGTPKALTALEKLATSREYTGALNTRGMARVAIAAIERRHLPKDPERWPDGPTPGARAILRGHGDHVWAIAFSPDGKTLASVGNDRVVRLWDVAAGKPAAAFAGPGRQTTEVSFAGPDLLAVAGSGEDGSVHLLDSKSGRESKPIAVNEGGVGSVAVSRDGKRLATTKSNWKDESSVVVLDVGTGETVATLPKASGALAFSPDGKLLVTGGGTEEDDVRLWDLATRKVVATMHGHTDTAQSASFSPDGKLLATGGDWTLRVWDVKTGNQVAKFRGDWLVSGVAFSPDGRHVAAGEAKHVRVWDVSAGKAVAVLEGNGPVAYSPDGKTLATRAADGMALLLWDLEK